ncbi:MAG: hypothetical protein ACRCZE_04770 [Candidatus Altimarinota bacterium]
MINLHQKPEFHPFHQQRLAFQTGEKPSAQSESSDKPKISLDDTQTYQGRKKIAEEAGKKIFELNAKGDQEQGKVLKQLLQEYYSSGRNLDQAKQAATNLYNKLDAGAVSNTPKTTASGIILMDNPFDELSRLNAKTTQPKLSEHQSKAPQLGKVIDLDNDQSNPIMPQSVAQRDGTVKIETPEDGARVATNPQPQPSQTIDLPEVKVDGEIREEVAMKDIDTKIGGEQYLEAIIKFKDEKINRVDFRTKDNQPAYVQKEGSDLKVYLI